jgi:hypothetical protein
MDESRGLQGVVRPLLAQMAPRGAAELFVYEGEKPMERLIVSGAPQPEKLAGRRDGR